MTLDVRVEELRFERRGRTVLSVDALHFPAGRTTAILGPNGAGKTTLLRLIGGLERPAGGRVLFGAPPEARRPGWPLPAFSFQRPVFVRGTVAENIELGLKLRGVTAAERRARVKASTEALEIGHLLGRPAGALSQGEAQRVNLARALALRAPVTLLDEPLSGFDAGVRAALVDTLPALLAAEGATAILVTHDRDEALRMAEHLVVLSGGRVCASGAAAEVLRSPPGAEAARLLGHLVLRVDGELVAIPPGALQVGEGSPSVTMEIERIVTLDRGREAVGRIDGQRARAALPEGTPAPEPGTSAAVAVRAAIPLPSGESA